VLLGEVEMGRIKVLTSVVKWSEGLSNRVPIIIRRYIDLIKFADYMAVSFITFCHILLVLFCIVVYMVVCFVCFCLILYKYLTGIIVTCDPFSVFCLIMLFCVLFVCKCVPYYCRRVSSQLQLTNMSYHLMNKLFSPRKSLRCIKAKHNQCFPSSFWEKNSRQTVWWTISKHRDETVV
jgi:hypothetical protein